MCFQFFVSLCTLSDCLGRTCSLTNPSNRWVPGLPASPPNVYLHFTTSLCPAAQQPANEAVLISRKPINVTCIWLEYVEYWKFVAGSFKGLGLYPPETQDSKSSGFFKFNIYPNWKWHDTFFQIHVFIYMEFLSPWTVLLFCFGFFCFFK